MTPKPVAPTPDESTAMTADLVKLRALAADLRAAHTDLMSLNQPLAAASAEAECRAGEVSRNAYNAFHSDLVQGVATTAPTYQSQAEIIEKWCTKTEAIQKAAKAKAEALAKQVPDALAITPKTEAPAKPIVPKVEQPEKPSGPTVQGDINPDGTWNT